MGDEDDGLVAKLLSDGTAEDVVGHVGVEGTERVIQDVNVAVAVEGACQADSLALPTAQVGATLTDLKYVRNMNVFRKLSFFMSKDNYVKIRFGSVTTAEKLTR